MSGTWAQPANLVSVRMDYAACNMADGRILVTGGRIAGGGGATVATCEIYDPVTQISTATGSMITNRRDHAIVLLDNGKILVVGGENGAGAGIVLHSGEIFDPNTEIWSSIADFAVGRSQFAIYKLGDGTVLIAGGFSSSLASTQVTELYHPVGDYWEFVGPLPQARGSLCFGLLQDGSPLAVCGSANYADLTGYNNVDRYDVISKVWTPVTPYPITMFPDISNSFVLMNDNKVLISGGFAGALNDATAACYRYDANADTWTAIGSLTDARWDHSSWLLPSGDVLIAGGTERAVVITTAEILNHNTLTWSLTGSLNEAHTLSNTVGVNVWAELKPFIAAGDNNGTPSSLVELYTIGSPPPMTISLVQKGTNYDSLIDLPVTISASSAGNLILVRIQARNPAAFTIDNVTDDAGNSYTNLTGANSTESGTPNGANQIWYAKNCLAGATTVTIHASTLISGFQGLVQEYSGVDNTTPVETSNATSDISVSGTSVTTPSITIANGNDLLVAIGDSVNAVATGVSAPWTGETGAWGTLRSFGTYLAPGSTGSFSATFTGVSTGNGAVSIAAFQPTIVGPSAKQKASTNLIFE